jgi:hypothetical protein
MRRWRLRGFPAHAAGCAGRCARSPSSAATDLGDRRCIGTGQHIALRLVADAETVIDVPPRQSAKVRVVTTRQRRKTDATEPTEFAPVGTRMAALTGLCRAACRET